MTKVGIRLEQAFHVHECQRRTLWLEPRKDADVSGAYLESALQLSTLACSGHGYVF